ncbi:MAG: hypothetical protein ABTQ25_17450 [Nitrosomonas ureae]
MKRPSIVCGWGGKDGDHLDLDAIRKPGQPTIDEIIRARAPKAEVAASPDYVKHLVGNLMALYELIRVTRDATARHSSLKAAIDLSQRILAVRRQVEIERHDQTILDIDRQVNELQLIGNLI